MKQATPQEVRAIGEKIDQEEREKETKRRDAFQMLFCEWLRNRAGYIDPATSDQWSVSDEFAHGHRETELARLITTTPALLPWMVWRKLEILEHYLVGEGEGTDWIDNRELVMLAGIKADLIRFGIGENKREGS